MNDSHGEKRPLPPQSSLLEGVRAVLIDVEGVTTPISFAKEVLIPYAKDYLKVYLETNFENENLQKKIDELRAKSLSSKEDGVEGAETLPANDAAKDDIISAVVKFVLAKIDGDLESTVRQLLELVWQDAYKSDNIQGELYDDVVPLLRMLVNDGIKIFSCSLNNVEAQKLLFGYSNQGDVMESFAGNFDFSIESGSERFTNIAAKMGHKPSEILYLTQTYEDATVAHGTGIKTCIVLREGNDPISDEHLQSCSAIYSLEELWEDEYEDELPAKRLHGDADPGLYYGEYSTDGATNDSEAAEEEGAQLGGCYGDHPHDAVGGSENGDSEDA